MWLAVFICSFYAVLSTGCILHNKYILAYVLPYENILLLAQNIFTIAFIVVFGKRHQAGETATNEVNVRRALIPRYALYHSKGDWAVGVCYSMSVVTGMWCLYHLTVPTFSAVKKSGMIVSWVIEALNPTATTWACFPSVMLVIAGSVIQTWFDLQFSFAGVVFGFLSCVFQSTAYEVGKRMVTHGKDLWSVLLINSVAMLIVQLLYMAVFGEMHIVGHFLSAVFQTDDESLAMITNRGKWDGVPSQEIPAARATRSEVVGHVVANCFLIMLMNLSIFLNCCVNSPLAHVVTGNVKGIVTTIAGIVLFSLTLNSMGYAGIVVAFFGGIWFSWVKYKHEMSKKELAAAAAAAAVADGTQNA